VYGVVGRSGRLRGGSGRFEREGEKCKRLALQQFGSSGLSGGKRQTERGREREDRMG
jgi:hypothetical protein